MVVELAWGNIWDVDFCDFIELHHLYYMFRDMVQYTAAAARMLTTFHRKNVPLRTNIRLDYDKTEILVLRQGILVLQIIPLLSNPMSKTQVIIDVVLKTNE